MVTGDTSAEHRPRRRWFVIGLAVASVVIVVSVVLSLAFARGGSESLVGRVDTSVAGARAPAFDLPRLEGGRLRLDQFEGSVVVVNFWASWCIPCREEAGTLESLARKSRGRGVRLVGVVENDTAAAARRFREDTR